MMQSFLSKLIPVIRVNRVVYLYPCQLHEPDDTVVKLPLTRTVLLAFVLPFCYNDTTPDCNLQTKEVSQCNYSWELCLLFSGYSPELEDTYYSQIIPGIIPGIIYQSLLTGHTFPWKIIGFGTPLKAGEPKVKLSSSIYPCVLQLPNGQPLELPFDVDDPRRQKTN